MDIEALRLFQAMMAMGLVDVDSGLQMARVIGSSMARIAEAETAPGSTPIVVPSGDSVVDADEFARSAGPRCRPWPACSSSCGAATSRPPPAGPC